MDPTPPPAPTGLSATMAAIGVVVIVVGVAAYLYLSSALHIEPYYGGFLFGLLFGAIKKMDPKQFLPMLLGSLVGIANAAALALLPVALGPQVGPAVALAITLTGTFCLLRGWLRIIINHAYLVFVTVATIPALQQPAPFVGMAASVLLGAAFLVVVVLVARVMAREKSRRLSQAV